MSRLHECLETLLNKYNIPVRNLGYPNINAYVKSIVQQLQSMSAAMSRDQRGQYFQEMLEIRNSITDENWSALHALSFPNGSLPPDYHSRSPRYIAEKAGLIRRAGNPGGIFNSNDFLGKYMANEFGLGQPQSYIAENRDVRHKLLEMYDCLLSIMQQLYPADFINADQVAVAEIKTGDQTEEDKKLDEPNGGRKMKTNKHKHKKGKNKKTNKRKKYNKIRKSRRTKK